MIRIRILLTPDGTQVTVPGIEGRIMGYVGTRPACNGCHIMLHEPGCGA